MLPPHRVESHETDSRVCKIVLSKFDDNWEVRDITGRDFGIDKIAERFEDGYATSEMILIQIKGTKANIDEKNPRFSIETKTLLYAEMFSIPFILIYCSVNNPKQCYYVWLQEYIRVRLNYEKEYWRNQRTNTIYFPIKNVLGTNYSKSHLEYISMFPKFKDSWVQFYLCLEDLGYYLPHSYCYAEMELEDIKYSVKGIKEKLEEALKKTKNIPKRFVPDNIQSVIASVRKIEEATSKPIAEDYRLLIANCSIIKSSMQAIAMRFDDNYLRLLYECDGTADY